MTHTDGLLPDVRYSLLLVIETGLGMSPSTLNAIVYISSSVQPMTGQMLEDLLLEARRLNLQSGVTGALIYSDDTFMQYFEGRPAAMAADTWERLCNSRRHSRIVDMMNEPTESREFRLTDGARAAGASDLFAISTASWVVNSTRSAAQRQLGRHDAAAQLLEPPQRVG